MLKSLAREALNEEKYPQTSRDTLYRDLALALNRVQGLSDTMRESAMSMYSAESFNKFGIKVSSSLNRKFTMSILESLLTENENDEYDYTLNGSETEETMTEEEITDEFIDDETIFDEIMTDEIVDDTPDEEVADKDTITAADVEKFFNDCARGVK